MKPIPPYQVREGADYWAAWGSKGWTAVRVRSAKRKWAFVDRIDPITNEVRSRKAKVRVDELVRREPKLKGKDKPEISPSVVFDDVRSFRAAQKATKLELSNASDEEDNTPVVRRAFEGWAKAQTEEFNRGVWEGLHGKGSWATAPTFED